MPGNSASGEPSATGSARQAPRVMRGSRRRLRASRRAPAGPLRRSRRRSRAPSRCSWPVCSRSRSRSSPPCARSGRRPTCTRSSFIPRRPCGRTGRRRRPPSHSTCRRRARRPSCPKISTRSSPPGSMAPMRRRSCSHRRASHRCTSARLHRPAPRPRRSSSACSDRSGRPSSPNYRSTNSPPIHPSRSTAATRSPGRPRSSMTPCSTPFTTSTTCARTTS